MASAFLNWPLINPFLFPVEKGEGLGPDLKALIAGGTCIPLAKNLANVP